MRPEGDREWWREGDRHRIGGAAQIVFSEDGVTVVLQRWFKDGIQHRDDGPANIFLDEETGEVEEDYWLHGQEVSKEEWEANRSKEPVAEPEVVKECKYLDEEGRPHREDGPALVYSDGWEEWRIHGQLHREDGPARTLPEGDEEWWLNGERHRIDGPAWRSFKEPGRLVLERWYVDGKVHREDGPASRWKGGHAYDEETDSYDLDIADHDKWVEEYFLNGQKFDSKELWEEAKQAS
jgi:hypothetical protein